MIRTRDWTYVHRYPDGPHDLYDLVNDSDERHDLADDRGRARRIRERHELMKEWFARHVDPSLEGSRETL